jgi:S-adenosylmethionine:tRNA ribosyltransferase-isomerase
MVFGNDELSGTIGEVLEDGRRIVRFNSVKPFESALDSVGQTPLPPYIKRDVGSSEQDRERYQTIYARNRGAIAAPTAGLHFSSAVMERIKSAGIIVAEITLHVGYGTFEPVRVDNLEEHRVSPERFEISNLTAEIVNGAKESGRRVIAVGTTTTRALETSCDSNGKLTPGSGFTNLTITPGFRFRVVDALLTNFHLPRSSLLFLVSAFAGYDLTINAYKHAVDAKYRFYSYGDCMLII